MKFIKKISSFFTIDNIFKVLAFSLFCVYLAQMYVGYDIDKKQVLNGFMTVFMLFLRWSTIVTVGFAVIVPFFGGKTCKAILTPLGLIVGTLNLIFLKENVIAWGPKTYTSWRYCLFIIEQVLILIISTYSLIFNIIDKNYKGLKAHRIILILLGMYATFMYQPMFNILFGAHDDKAVDFTPIHIIFLLMNFVLIIGGYVLMKNKTKEEKNIFFAALACSGVFNFFYYPYTTIAGLPFHLCNTAIIMMFVAFIFNAKGIFYFTYFVNVIGAIFASIFPDIYGDAFSLESIRYWYNHIYALSLPILGVALKVYERPTIKFMGKAIFWFTIYYLIVIFFNAWFSNYAPVNYFFINGNFFFEKLNIQTTIKDNYVWEVPVGDLLFVFYPLFHFLVYVVYIGLMFVMWYIYDALFHVADSHYDLRLKKAVIKQGFFDLREELKNKSLAEPLYEENLNMIEIKNFTKIYSGSKAPAVDNFSLTVNNGEVFGFLGHNGAGKSTTIKSLVGIQSITGGQIIVDGFDVEKQPVEAKLRIGYVSDNHAVYERLTGREYINYIADLYLVSQEDRDERIAKYCKMFKLEDAIDREIKSYSHGMKQKIVVISSLIHEPKVWVLDEPLTGLDPTSSFQIKECMREHAKKGHIVFFSSHVIEVVEKICDKICIINHGKLECIHSLKDLKEQGVSLEELYLKYVTNEESDHA